MNSSVGMVYLVGAGPGDPGLLTLRGLHCLQQADVVLYDYLASAELLRHVPSGAECICLGRHGAGRLMSQEEVNRLLIEHAQAGRQVVRLKGGDPGIFGRLKEEVAPLLAAGVPFEVVPGVTTAAAAGAYAGITLTDRDHASCVALVTGRERAGKDDLQTLDYAGLARFPGTLVFYMGVTTAPKWSQALIDHGKPADTPVVIVRHCSLPMQQSWRCRLDEVPRRLAPGAIRPPVVVIVGQVACEQSLGRWFTDRPLFGKAVLVTRPAHQTDAMARQLRDLGAAVWYQPAIEIRPVRDWAPVDHAIDRLSSFDWLVFSSSNGVEAFLNRLRSRQLDWRALAGLQLAAIGPATTAALASRDLRVDLQPAEFRAEALAAALEPVAAGKRFLLLRASRGREVLGETLRAAGGEVEQVTVYESRDTATADPAVAEALAAGQIDWVTVTSPSTAESLVRLFGSALGKARLAAISPLTGTKLEELGYPPAAVASRYTTEGVIEAMVAAVRASAE